MSPKHETTTSADVCDVVIVGAGFSGLYMLHRARQLGLSARIFEVGSGVGGTWYWNRYPGARCDIESFDYQYSFSPELLAEWRWSERYPRQDEILAYLEFVADKFEMRDHIQLDTRVTAAGYDASSSCWTVETSRGDQATARFVVMATGCLSTANVPAMSGLDDFSGPWYHTGAWPHEAVDFSGKRVAVIGTGSSGIQVIPEIAEVAAELFVFQRTPSFSIPAFNRKLTPDEAAAELSGFADRRQHARESHFGIRFPMNDQSALEVDEQERWQALEKQWQLGGLAMMGTYADILTQPEVNDTAVAFVHDKIRQKVSEPELAERLLPRGYPLGGKRICLDTNYFETFNRQNVTLVDVSDNPIERITPKGIRAGVTEYDVDAIVFATGFDAMTGAILAVDIKGRDGVTLRDKWSAGPRTLLGLSSAGFPNLFFITGPGSPSVFSNMIVSIEQHVDWITEAIEHVTVSGLDSIEATEDAETQWVQHVNDVANSTLIPKASSWYLGANVPGKPRIFMPYVGGVGTYRQICDDVAAKGYEGFALTKQRPHSTQGVVR
ncbi:NAD(P)/FAD-dependent oxidoreductase [Mycobacterium sp. URHB0044]|uniref:flavin-containing monooxygenase n=1 Tax=Mycobacterium sp. URHB0044 TaxID=1380386 RepID=UPI0004913C58|nr:NAD(P)/FAD-dependent oxidoreductase [Mycobacterium sp. URHB0044]